MLKLLFAVAVFLVVGCASQPKYQGPPVTPEADAIQAQMQKGMKALEREDYNSAADIFDKMLKQKPASEFDLIIQYNDGVAHEGMGDCKRAAELYRQTAHGSIAMKTPKVEAESLYRLSFAYDCLGDDRKSVAALLDARRRSSGLTPDVSQAELPARLAAGYARLGERAKATQYFKEALNGLKRTLVSAGTTTKVQQRFAARTLYAMGQLTTRQRSLSIEPNAFLKSLSVQQPYLLQSAEQAVRPESQKAAEDLIFAYENFLRLTPAEPEKTRPFLELALQDIAELKRIRMPGKGVMVDEIYDKVDVQESRVRQMLMAQSETMPLTDAAKGREGLRRQGRTVGPSELEKKAKSP